MKATVVRALYFWLVLVIIIQPFLSQRDYLLNLVVKSNASYMAEKAAVEGRVTPAIRDEIMANLRAVGFTDSEISISGSGTTSTATRGQSIEIILAVKRPPSFAIDVSTESGAENFYSRVQIMSEYIP